MAEVIQEYAATFVDARGVGYRAAACGEERADGTWEGWIEFRPAGEGGEARRTGRETSQPDRGALAYWASGLEAVYLEGAFERAA